MSILNFGYKKEALQCKRKARGRVGFRKAVLKKCDFLKTTARIRND